MHSEVEEFIPVDRISGTFVAGSTLMDVAVVWSRNIELFVAIGNTIDLDRLLAKIDRPTARMIQTCSFVRSSENFKVFIVFESDLIG